MGYRGCDRFVLQAGPDGACVVAEGGTGGGGVWQLPGNKVLSVETRAYELVLFVRFSADQS